MNYRTKILKLKKKRSNLNIKRKHDDKNLRDNITKYIVLGEKKFKGKKTHLKTTSVKALTVFKKCTYSQNVIMLTPENQIPLNIYQTFLDLKQGRIKTIQFVFKNE